MNINANAAALATQPAKPAPVGPKAGPSSPERTAQTLTHPAHRQGDKAHKVRTQAHKERPFKEHVQENQKTAEGEQLPEHAQNAQSGDRVQASAQTKPVQSEDVTSKPVAGAAKQPSDEAQTSSEPADQAAQVEDADAKQATEAEPFVQSVVSQVMEAVDPALRFKVGSRTMSSVNAQASAAMRTGDADAKQQPAVQGGDQASPQPQADLVPAGAATTQPSRSEQFTPSDGASAQPIAQSTPDAAAAKMSSSAKSEQAATTVNAATRAATPDAAPVSGRVTLTPSLSVTVAPSIGVATPNTGVQAKAPQGAPPPPPAQQVQQAFEVAMHDLPAPAGERLVTLKMNPASLGTLRIALHVSGENVQVRFQVGSGKARAAINDSMEDLKAAVERQGLRITSVEVEEDRALTAPGGVQLDNDGRSVAPAAGEAGPATSGKGFAQLLNAPPGSSTPPDGMGADPRAAATAEHAGEGAEDGVLQVLTFRLDAVA